MFKLKKKILLVLICICALIITNPIHILSKKDKEIKTIDIQQENSIHEIFAETLEIYKEELNKKEIIEEVKIVEKPKYTEDELYWLAKIVHAETFYDTDKGQQAVANVVINRVNSSDFPNSIYDVIWQKTGKTWQFSPCEDGGINREPDERAIENARLILEGKRILPEDILFFYKPTKGNKNDWIRTRNIYDIIGVHRFCY